MAPTSDTPPGAGHCYTTGISTNTRSFEKHKTLNKCEVRLGNLCASAIFEEFMLIYAQIYAGKTGGGLCCVGPVSVSDVAHLTCVK